VGNPGIKKIWGLAKSPELSLTDEELHLVVQAHTGKGSIRALTSRELQAVIGILAGMKESSRKAIRAKGRGGGNAATENQRRKIYRLTQELGWDKPARVDGLCRKMFKVDKVEWLDYMQCSKLIEALKNMLGRQNAH
jgi:phage gp16-like protein